VNRITAFMPRNLVRYEWTVTETEIEDHYELILETVFDTSVPAPVITIEPAKIDLAKMQDGQMHVDFVITNHGLVSAENAFLRFDKNGQYEVELLSDYYGEIMPQETIVVPAIIRDTYYMAPQPATSDANTAVMEILAADSSSDCERNFKGNVYYRLVCGDDGKWKTVPVYVGFWTCPKDTNPTRPTNPPGQPKDPVPPSPEDDEEEVQRGGSGKTPVSRPNSGLGGGGGGGGGSSPGNPYITYGMVAGDIVGTQCDPCPGKRYDAFVGCAISFLPLNCPLTILKSAWDISSTCTSKGAWSFDCLKNVAGSVVGAATSCVQDSVDLTPLGIGYNIAWCLYDIATACDSVNPAQFAAGLSTLESLTGQTFGDVPMDDQTAALMYQQAQQLEKMLDGLTVIFGDPIWFSGTDISGNVYWNLMEAIMLSVDESGDAGLTISDNERAELLTLPMPNHMDTSHIHAFCDRWNRSLEYWQTGKYTAADLDPGDNPDFIDAEILNQKSTEAAAAAQKTLDQGFDHLFDGAYYAKQEFLSSIHQGSEGVCAKVKVQVKQDAVMTRTAFNASLQLDNQSDKSIHNVFVEIQITDESGSDVTHLFGIYPPSLSGISSIHGTDSLAAGAEAKAEWIILPTHEAAPDAEKVFYVGAALVYDIDDLEVMVPIYPDMITVKPEAQLSIQYFHQKDVYADDPFTDELEPAEPYSLGMMVTNTGAGPARNVQITSAQPQIIRREQDKNILVDFEIINAELNGNALLDSLTVNMGDINPGGRTIARWQMVSPLQGEFVSYSASFEHINGLGDSRLSLIQNVEVHELIHCVRMDEPVDDRVVDFLVNDLADANAIPDTLYTSNGLIDPVHTVTDARVDGFASREDLQIQLTAAPLDGNIYIQITNPAEEGLVLASVVRSDGKIIMPDYNAWTTDRVVRPLDKPHYRQRLLHLFDTDSTGVYTLTYTTVQNPLKIETILLKADPVATADVTFDTPVDPASLDWTDMELTRNYGSNLITFPVAIQPLSSRSFRISGLAYLTAPAGRYELRMKTSGVVSSEGIQGASIYKSAWIRTLEPWDINHDEIVNFMDLAFISQNWTFHDCSAPVWCGGGDVNRDSHVNIEDVLILCEHWLDHWN
ncbi:MAG: hypothetical protein JXB18_05085, partial [Sedimentisphaerales bacterium]|nr:hypothetical protein [Sedimentisphaerales bacterium]